MSFGLSGNENENKMIFTKFRRQKWRSIKVRGKASLERNRIKYFEYAAFESDLRRMALETT